jgi:hypothetical protein
MVLRQENTAWGAKEGGAGDDHPRLDHKTLVPLGDAMAALFMLFISWLWYSFNCGAFRTVGVSERSRCHWLAAVLDSPVFLMMAVGLVWQCLILPKSFLATDAWLSVAFMAALGLPFLLGDFIRHRIVHAYVVVGLIPFALAALGQNTAALVVVLAAFWFARCFEDSLWAALGQVAIYGQGVRDWYSYQSSQSELLFSMWLCIALLVDHLTGDSHLPLTVFFGIVGITQFVRFLNPTADWARVLVEPSSSPKKRPVFDLLVSWTLVGVRDKSHSPDEHDADH